MPGAPKHLKRAGRTSLRSNSNPRTVVIVSNNDWDDFWYQRQEFASRFAARGDRVVFINKTLTRMPKLKSLLTGRYRKGNRGYVRNATPARVEVLTPLWLPPSRLLRPLNRLLIRRTLRTLVNTHPVVIVYAPSYNAIDVIDTLGASKAVYVNVHNYEAKDVLDDILQAELQLVRNAHYLFGDSVFNVRRLESKLDGRSQPVRYSPPGVDLDVFQQAYRGDEVEQRRSLYYYGGIGPHLDIELYEKLSREFHVVFIGKIAATLEGKLPDTIEVRQAVPMNDLGTQLRQADILTVFYKNSPYIQAVIPAKMFECLATGKPVLVSGLSNITEIADVIYDVNGSLQRARDAIAGLPITETDLVRSARQQHASAATWAARFTAFTEAIGEATGTPGVIKR